MSGSGKSISDTRSRVPKGDGARAGRLRAALRENLKRRKSQARQRSVAPSHDSAGIVPDNGSNTSQD